jgi:hypothetical protein
MCTIGLERVVIASEKRSGMRWIGYIQAVRGTILAAALGATFMGCGGDGSSGSASPIVGRWRLTTMQASGLTLNCPGSLTVPSLGSVSCSDNDTVQYNSDGTFTASGNIAVNGGGITFFGNGPGANSTSGTWQLSGDQLTVRVVYPSTGTRGLQTATVTARFSGPNQTWTGMQSNTTVVETFVRI